MGELVGCSQVSGCTNRMVLARRSGRFPKKPLFAATANIASGKDDGMPVTTGSVNDSVSINISDDMSTGRDGICAVRNGDGLSITATGDVVAGQDVSFGGDKGEGGWAMMFPRFDLSGRKSTALSTS